MPLNDNEMKILNYIREGRNTMADFTDNLGISAPAASKIVEELELCGYLVREGINGIKRFNFLLTDKGVTELPELSDEEKNLLIKEKITMNQYRVLKYVKGNPDVIAAIIAQELKIPAMELISDLCYLVKNEFLEETGLLRRKVSIIQKGEELLQRLN